MKDSYLEIEEFKRVKTFMKSMNLLGFTLVERQAYLKDKRLSAAEKKIVEALIKLKDCLYGEIIESLANLATSNELIEAQRLLILGVAYTDSADPEKGRVCLEEANAIFRKHKLDRYEFNGLTCLAYPYINTKKTKELARIVERLEELKAESIYEQASFLRIKLYSCMLLDNLEQGRQLLNKILSIQDQMSSSQVIAFLVDKFIFHVKEDRYDLCASTLESMKAYRSFNFSLNFRFMKTMLSHITDRTPIYLNEKDFEESPKLYFELKVIKGLEEGDLKSAKAAWAKMHEMNSEVYGEFLNYSGDKCLFSLCLNLYKQDVPKSNGKVTLSGSIEDRVLNMLLNSSVPVRKEAIYQEIWGQTPESKEDLKKLIMIILRLRKKTGHEIVSRKGSYFISKSKAS